MTFSGSVRKLTLPISFLLSRFTLLPRHAFLFRIVVLTLATVSLTGCGSNEIREHRFSGPTMGTWYNVKIIAPLSQDECTRIAKALEDTLEEINQLMSTYVPDSELSLLNAHTAEVPFSLSAKTRTVFSYALQVSQESDGAFDVTVGPLVNAWGFGPNTPDTPPTDSEIATLLERVGFQKLVLDEEAGTISKKRADLYCDLSAIAKGYAVDAMAQVLESMGKNNFMVEIGGEIVVRGYNAQKEPWRIAIEEPLTETRALHCVLPLQDIALATSGDYRNFVEVDGKRLSHAIDPKTGTPIFHELASVSVLHESCALADAYATAILVLGAEKGLAFAESQNLAVLMLVHDQADGFREKRSSAFQALFPELPGT